MFSPWTQHTAPQLRPPTLTAKWLLLRDAPGSLHCQPALHPPPIPRGAMLRFAAHLGHQLLLEGREALGHHRHVLAAHKSARASEAAHAEAAAAGRARASSLWARGTHFFLMPSMLFLLKAIEESTLLFTLSTTKEPASAATLKG
jgi:hypothetical protein